MPESRLTFDALPTMTVAALVAALVVVIAWRRRLAVPKASLVLAFGAVALLLLAAGLPHWRRPLAGEVAVLVDLSPSTRSAAFRDRATAEKRVKELLGSTPYRLYRFGDGSAIADDDSSWSELAVPRTRFDPPPAAAVLLFTDGRFDLPTSAPPTYAVIDPSLSRTVDARMATLMIDGLNAVATVAVDAPGSVPANARSVTWLIDGTADPSATALQSGSIVLRRMLAGSEDLRVPTVSARLSPGDPWPENDALSIVPPPPEKRERWYVTAGPTAPTGYRLLSPTELPGDAASYLAPSAIVLDNLPASAIPATAQERLTQFVRDLGGGLLISGGDRSFSAGNYVGTPLDAVSPLASVPPKPSTAWILLTDGSGSMNADVGPAARGTSARTRWQSATAALLRLLPSLPPHDPVTLGHFAADVIWWTADRPASETQSIPLPPAGIAAGGVTNLRPAIETAAAKHDPSMPGHLLILSDADADVGDVGKLIALLKSRNLKLHLLAVGDGKGLADLRRVVDATGGAVVQQTDADRWADAASELLQAAGEKHLMSSATNVRFLDRLASLPSRRVSPWNRTWLKPRATLLAATPDAGSGGEAAPLSASWPLGAGTVAAIGFTSNDAERAAIAGLVAAPPHDPRFNISVTPGGRMRIRVDAVDPNAAPADRFLNELPLNVELSTEEATPGSSGDSSRISERTTPIPQIAPGRYELEIDAPGRPLLAVVRTAEKPIGRFAVAGRYPKEFDAIGIDRGNLNQLIERFGGAVIEPDQTKPINLRWPMQAISLASWLAAGAAVLLGAALLWWRWA